MKPRPWSHSALADFVNCGRQYHEVRIKKSVPFVETKEITWGNIVHKAFENRIAIKAPLAADLAEHEPYMQQLEALPGKHFTERKIALNNKMQDCGYFDNDVWFRSVIDFSAVAETEAHIVDYKTGKQKDKFDQLMLNALHLFAQYPSVQTIHTSFYWVQHYMATSQTFTRDQVPALWSKFLPDLKQYVEAHVTETWQPRQSGLCAGWCQIEKCEFWRSRRRR